MMRERGREGERETECVCVTCRNLNSSKNMCGCMFRDITSHIEYFPTCAGIMAYKCRKNLHCVQKTFLHVGNFLHMQEISRKTILNATKST